MVQTNSIKCRYCDWRTLRFRGKQRGEGALRVHVIEEHWDAYVAQCGLQAREQDVAWEIDTADIGEQAL